MQTFPGQVRHGVHRGRARGGAEGAAAAADEGAGGGALPGRRLRLPHGHVRRGGTETSAQTSFTAQEAPRNTEQRQCAERARVRKRSRRRRDGLRTPEARPRHAAPRSPPARYSTATGEPDSKFEVEEAPKAEEPKAEGKFEETKVTV